MTNGVHPPMVETIQTKPPKKPRIVVVNDDLPLIVDGTIYHPHAGEWVEFKQRPSIGLYLELAQMENTMEGIQLLADSISAWNWTDDNGKPYTSPPTADVIKTLPLEEFGWLIRNAGREAAPNIPN